MSLRAGCTRVRPPEVENVGCSIQHSPDFLSRAAQSAIAYEKGVAPVLPGSEPVAAGSRLMVATTSSNPSPNTSCSKKAARSSGERRSSAKHQRQGDVLLFLLFERGIGSHGPT